MAILENILQAEIDAVSAHAYRLYNAGDLQSYLELHERAWSMYPEPRNNWNEAYNTAKYAHSVPSPADVPQPVLPPHARYS